MRRFRCDGSQFGHANNLPEGLGSRIENVLFAVYSRPQNNEATIVGLIVCLSFENVFKKHGNTPTPD